MNKQIIDSNPLQAVIDIGTNSTRLLIYRFDGQGQIRRVDRAVRYTRMGQDVNQTGKLHPEAMQRNTAALTDYKKITAEYGIPDESVFIFATSAMRDAENSPAYIQKVRDELNWQISVIPGEREADLGFKGVSQCFDGDILVFDIGGGSTELILGSDDRIIAKKSINMGCVRSTEKYILNDPPILSELDAVRSEALKNVEAVLSEFPQSDFKTLVGIGGTATTLSAMKQAMTDYDSEKIHQSVLTIEEVRILLDRLRQMPLSERQTVPGLAPQRADVIIAGLCIAEAIMTATGRETYTVCDYDNLEGAAIMLKQNGSFFRNR